MMPDDFIAAGDVRPDHFVSLTGMEKDAAYVTDVKPINNFEEIQITLETGKTKAYPITFPILMCEDE